MAGFMGTFVSGAAAASQGQELIAELDQKKAQTENTKAEAQVRQMEVLQQKQKLQSAKDVGDWMKASATADAQKGKDGVQQLQQLQAGADEMLKKGDMYGYETMTKLATEKTKQLKDLHVQQEDAKATKLETLAQTAAQFQVAQTPALGEQLVKAAVDAGENPVNIPQPGTPQFTSWAKDKQTAAMSSADKVKFLTAEADRQRAFNEKQDEHRDHEADLAASRALTASNQAATQEMRRESLDFRRQGSC